MPKAINLGNGSILIGLDRFAQVKDFYFHYPGLENHVSENLTHKVGIFVDNQFSWIDDGSWNADTLMEKGTMASDVSLKSSNLGIELHFTDCVYNEKNIFVREVMVRNLFNRRRNLKLFFNQQFNITQTHTGETAYYDPREEAIIHYKGRRVFLINAMSEKKKFGEYSVGLLGIEGRDGTFRDAEDGILSGNPIEHGAVDSVISIDLDIPANKDTLVYYWICVAKSIYKAKRLNEEVKARGPEDILSSTKNYWKAWVALRDFNFYGLSKDAAELFKHSLFNIRSHVAYNGAIIASGDSEMLQFGRDYYEYVWPRDAAFTAISLIKAGDLNVSRKFFRFCEDTITSEGYFMHKYRPDKSLGSSWHPWVRNGHEQFPIQEDETALPIVALWEYYKYSKDLEFVESLYNPLVKRAADFMVFFRDDKTGLPHPSYDLWERLYGIHTFTAASVYAALTAASNFAALLGKTTSHDKYEAAAESIKKSILKYLYSKDEGYFYKSVSTEERQIEMDKTYDVSSFFGIYKFGVLPVEDEIIKKAFSVMFDRLSIKTDAGGIARFEGDSYHHLGGDYPGNPWIITSMWLAQYYIEKAKNETDMSKVKESLEWCVKYASQSGTLPEQLNAYTGEHLSASPLVWSHAEYVTTVVSYLEKLEKLGICKACNNKG